MYPVAHRNALDVLRHDHQRLKDLFESFSESDNLAEQKDVLTAIFREVRLHARMELEILYPALLQVAVHHLLDQGQEEQQDMEAVVEDLEGMDARDPRFSDKFVELEDKLLHHIHDQESELFMQAEEMGADLDRLGSDMRDLRTRLLAEKTASPEPHAPRSRRRSKH